MMEGVIRTNFKLNLDHEPKYQVGDIVYNRRVKEHYLIEDIEYRLLGPIYHFRTIETGVADSDSCIKADKSKNLSKVG